MNKNQHHKQDQEWGWIEEIKAGHPLSFEKLYHKHSSRLYTLCLHFLRRPEDAEDALQEIFIKLLRGLPAFRREASFSTWSYRIAVNHLSKSIHKRKSQPENTVSEEWPAPGNHTHLELVLAEVTAQLPELLRKVFVLHDRLGLNHTEIANIIGCKVGTSRSHLCRARIQLREKLTRLRASPRPKNNPCKHAAKSDLAMPISLVSNKTKEGTSI